MRICDSCFIAMAGNMAVKKSVLLLVMAVLALGAGVVLGWAWTPLPRAVATVPEARAPRPWFDQLDLTADQQKQMDKIWSDARQQRQKMFEQFRDLDRARDQQIQGLLDESQLSRYHKIIDGFHAKRDQLNKQRDALIADAAARSRELLNDSQKAKWDILAKEMRGRHGAMGPSTRPSGATPSAGEGRHHP
jgi:Spy/CpxP family protein refolding chaperone